LFTRSVAFIARGNGGRLFLDAPTAAFWLVAEPPAGNGGLFGDTVLLRFLSADYGRGNYSVDALRGNALGKIEPVTDQSPHRPCDAMSSKCGAVGALAQDSPGIE
jgi:hypothetical protein